MELTPPQIDNLLASIRVLLEDPTVEVTLEGGVLRLDDPTVAWFKFEPGQDEVTLTIKTAGGAQDTTSNQG